MLRKLFHRWFFCSFAGAVLLLSAGCNTTRFLKDDELLLVKNEIVLTGTKDVKNKKKLSYELTTLYKQRPNQKFFFFVPRQWFYYRTNAPEDTTGFKKWQRRRLAEVPAILSDTLTRRTEEQMIYYLNYLGYFQADADHEVVQKGKHKALVRYYVTPGEVVLIDTVHFSSADTAIHRELQDISSETVFKRGTPLEGNLYDIEKERITRHLRNNGYAYFFSNNFAELDADTTESQKKTTLYLEVIPPPGESSHQLYTIGNITIYSQFDATLPDSVYRDTIVDGFLFKLQEPEFLVRPQTILNSVHLHTGEMYSQENYDRSLQHLSSLGVFRFVRIRLDNDADNPAVLHLRIELTQNKKYELGFDLDANYIDGYTLTGRGSLMGLAFSPTAQNRNLFKGAELNVTSLNAGVEVNFSALNTNAFWNSVELGLQNELYFPKFVDYLYLWRGMNRLPLGKKKLLSDGLYQSLQDKAASRLSARYNYVFNFGWYETSLLNASFGYDVPLDNNTRVVLDHVGIDFLRPVTQPAFDTILAANPFLARSFGKQLFVSLFFREFNLSKQRRPNRYGESGFNSLNIELAGAEIWAGNALYNAFALSQDTLRVSGTDFSQYARIEWDTRYFKEYTPNLGFAARFNIGIARPFGFSSDVPYVKQFFVGGPNSIRGWAARGLGPGGYLDTLSTGLTNRLLFYQTGDLKLEFNAEMRFHLFSRLKGAVFLDAGNVWTLRPDRDRCGSQFLFSRRVSENCPTNIPFNDPFYKQIAVSTGLGFRLDFNYFIFRLDLGIPLRYPRPVRNMMDTSPREADYWHSFQGWKLNDVNFNFGLGYPF